MGSYGPRIMKCDIDGDGVIDMSDFETLKGIRSQRYNTFFKTHGYLK